MSFRKSRVGISTLLLYAAIVAFSPRAGADVMGAMSVGAVLGELRRDADALIERGRQAGDFIIWRAGNEAKQFVDQWERANQSLINTTFEKLDAATQRQFRQMDATIERLEDGLVTSLEEGHKIVEQIGNQLQTIPLIGGTASVARYSPRVIVPPAEGADPVVRLRVFGPLMHEADARMQTPNATALTPRSTRATELVFELDRSVLPSDTTKHRIVAVPLEFTSNPNTIRLLQQRSTHQLEFFLLPQIAAEISVNATVSDPEVQRRTVQIHMGQFQGRNTRIHRGVSIPEREHGWRLDLSRRSEIALVDGGGDRGRCEGIEEHSINENGLTMFARVDNRDRWGGAQRRDGVVSCGISLPVYRTVPRTREVTLDPFPVVWNADISRRLPAATKSLRISARTFDGRIREFTGTGEDEYFSIRVEGDNLIVRPKPPRDF